MFAFFCSSHPPSSPSSSSPPSSLSSSSASSSSLSTLSSSSSSSSSSSTNDVGSDNIESVPISINSFQSFPSFIVSNERERFLSSSLTKSAIAPDNTTTTFPLSTSQIPASLSQSSSSIFQFTQQSSQPFHLNTWGKGEDEDHGRREHFSQLNFNLPTTSCEDKKKSTHDIFPSSHFSSFSPPPTLPFRISTSSSLPFSSLPLSLTSNSHSLALQQQEISLSSQALSSVKRKSELSASASALATISLMSTQYLTSKKNHKIRSKGQIKTHVFLPPSSSTSSPFGIKTEEKKKENLSLLLSLPFDILKILIIDLLTIEEVCNLDSSICFRTFRSMIISLFKHKSMVFPGDEVTKRDDSFFRWVAARHISVRRVVCRPDISDATLRDISINLTDLEMIGLRYCNNITETSFIALVKGCSKIKNLDVGYCDVISDNLIVHASTSLPFLETIDLSISREMAALEGHEGLLLEESMANQLVTDQGLEWLGENSPLLKSMKLNGRVVISDEGLEGMVSLLENLHTLNLNNCSMITDTGLLSIMEYCSKLEHLELCCGVEEYDISADVIEAFLRSVAGNLKTFSIAGIDITDETLVVLSESCEKLTSLALGWRATITSEGLMPIANKLCHLQSFKTQLTCVNDNFIKALTTNCKDMIEFNISATDDESMDFVTDLSLEYIADAWGTTLKHFTIGGCTEFTSVGLKRLCRKTSSLESFAVEHCPQIDSVLPVMMMIRNNPHLKTLCLTGFASTNITDSFVYWCAEHGTSVVKITLCSVSSLTDMALQKLLESLPKLEYLSLHCAELLSEGCMSEITTHCPLLHTLSISANPLITQIGVIKILSKGKLLRDVNFGQCENFDKTKANTIRNCYPKITLSTHLHGI